MSLKSQEMFTHSVGNGMVLFVEREVEKFAHWINAVIIKWLYFIVTTNY